MIHSECSCTSECEGRDVSGRRVHADSRESSLCLDKGRQRNEKGVCARICKDDCMADIAAGIGGSIVHTNNVCTDKEVSVNTEQGHTCDSDIALLMEQHGDGKGHWNGEGRLVAPRDANTVLLNEAPFQSQYSTCSVNAVLCASPGHSNCMQEEDVQKQQTNEGVFGPNSDTSNPVSCSKADRACTGAPGSFKKTMSIIDVSQKIEHMTKSLMESRAASSVSSKHSETGVACKTGGETRTQPVERKTSIGSRLMSTKATHAPTGFAISKTQYKIFFTSEDAKNADADTSIQMVTFPQGSSGSLGKTRQEKAGHTSASHLYKNSQVLSMCAGRAAVYNGADVGPSAVHLVKTKHKDTIQVDCTTPQYTGPSAVPESVHAADTRHSLHEDATSYEDSLCDLVERLSTKNNIEDVCAPIQREVHYVDHEVTAKDRRREKKGFLCRFFSTVFGCCT